MGARAYGESDRYGREEAAEGGRKCYVNLLSLLVFCSRLVAKNGSSVTINALNKDTVRPRESATESASVILATR
jgi:hypothetical protein